MKMVYVFLGIFSLKLACMEKPRAVRVKAAAAAWPPAKKPAAATTPLKRSSDEEEETKKFRRRRHKSIDLGASTDSFMEEAKKSVVKTVVLTLAQETKKEIEEGRLKIISVDPPVCEVIQQSLTWPCRYGCRREFNSKLGESEHIRLVHNIIPADPEQEWGFDWGEINKIRNYISMQAPSLPEQDQEEEEVEEIVA